MSKSTKAPASTTAGSLLRDLFVAPLYTTLSAPSSDAGDVLRALRTRSLKVDHYCPSCRKPTTWQVQISREDSALERSMSALPPPPGRHPPNPKNWFQDFTLTLECARHSGHRVALHVRVVAPTSFDAFDSIVDGAVLPALALEKVGQFPSLTDFELGELNQLEEGMNAPQREDYVRAINCMAHGFNVAACVHLRRVFESILWEARNLKLESERTDTWPEFDAMDTNQRVAALRGFVPDFMADHPHLYSILSKGVHQLSEDECKQALPTVREAIDLMIEERVEAAQRKKRREKTSRLLSQQVNRFK